MLMNQCLVRRGESEQWWKAKGQSGALGSATLPAKNIPSMNAR
jgi:hypothetical protein